MSKDSPVRAVGYIRLSSEKQAADDQAFKKQAERLRRCCQLRGFELLAVYEDTWSGADPLGVVRRNGLNDAVKSARDNGAVLVITEPTRLFRHVEAAREFLTGLDVPVFSVRHGRFMKAPALLREIAKGEAWVMNMRKATAEGMAVRIAAGAEFSTKEVRAKAAKASAKVRTLKADDIAHQIATVLQSDPAYRSLSNKALAELLNRRGILSGWKRLWTPHGVRSARKRAETMIAEQDEVETWVSTLPVKQEAKPQADHAPVQNDQVSDIEDADEAEMRSLPTFGLF